MRHALLAFLFLLCACAVPHREPQPPSLRPAFDALLVGKSTKADVRAALGEAVVVDFDSGYAVWVYREKQAEFVLLFVPPGILAKARSVAGGLPARGPAE